MNKEDFRLIIIDDNPKIAQDVIKVLSTKKSIDDDFDDLDNALFGDTKNNKEKVDLSLPHFIFETAMQGQDGVEKIKQAKEEGKHFALAFVDVRMPPGWDGIETIIEIWKIDPDVQVVICTAYSDYSWEETVNELGVNANFLILKKPFDNLALRQLACGLTQKWLLEKKVKKNTEVLEEKIEEKTQSLHVLVPT